MADISKFERGLDAALLEALKWMGATSPNPPVGAAALDMSGDVIAVAAHTHAGGPHAEAALLELCRQNGTLKDIHTLCVTLEPCNHQGRTPPCTDAIIKAGIGCVVVGTKDPNPHVKGGGIEHLEKAGIKVITSIREEASKKLIHAFAYHALTGKPFVTVKRAFNKSGSMIPSIGQKTFTSQKSLHLAHALRKKADAILTGSGTILADSPLFTVRHLADFPEKKRLLAILDRRGRVPQSYVKSATERGFHVVLYQDIAGAIEDLSLRGARDILVEAGPLVSKAFLDCNFWTASVKITASDSDEINIAFNPEKPIPFDINQFSWDYFLPS